MLIVTAKVPKRKLAFGVALAAMACCCALVLNLGTSAVREVASPSVPDPKGVKTNEDRVGLSGRLWLAGIPRAYRYPGDAHSQGDGREL